MDKILTLFILISIMSCSNKQKELYRELCNLRGKEIYLPDSLGLYQNGLCIGTVNDCIVNDRMSFIVLIDGNCHKCIDVLKSWKSFAKLHKHVHYNFIINAKEYVDFENYCKLIDFNLPVVYDRYNTYSKLNRLNDKIEVLLLDKEQKIILYGSPFLNQEMLEGYSSFINNHHY